MTVEQAQAGNVPSEVDQKIAPEPTDEEKAQAVLMELQKAQDAEAVAGA